MAHGQPRGLLRLYCRPSAGATLAGTSGLNRSYRDRGLARLWPVALAGASLLGGTRPAAAVVLDGTSGANSIATTYSTTGNLTLELGFFVEYLAVGGGGGGGGGGYMPSGFLAGGGGGGGAGAVVSSSTQIAATSYSVTVGGGGTGAGGGTSSVFNGGVGTDGTASTAFSSTANGGVGGWGAGINTLSPLTWTDQTGGIGQASGSSQAGGGKSSSIGGAGGGGGGSSGVGAGAGSSTGAGGAGGSGTSSSIAGSAAMFGVGGTGGTGSNANTTGATGDVNTGNGGGGGGGNSGATAASGGNGGSGLVVVRYQGAQAATGGTISSGTGTATGYTLHQFTNTGNSAIDFSALDFSTRLGATLTSNLAGSGNLTYSGPGQLALSGTGSYSGTTTVSAGTLLINGNNSTATGSVAVLSGATLGGNGTVGGSTTIQGGGIHSPGTSPGIQTFSQNLSYASGAGMTWELIANDATPGDAGTDYDQVAVLGILDFAGATSLGLSFNGAGSSVNWTDSFWSANQTWLVWDAGTVSNFSNLSITTANWLDSNSATLSSARPQASFSVAQVGQDVLLVYTVPESATAMWVGGAAAVWIICRVRRAGRRSSLTAVSPADRVASDRHTIASVAEVAE